MGWLNLSSDRVNGKPRGIFHCSLVCLAQLCKQVAVLFNERGAKIAHKKRPPISWPDWQKSSSLVRMTMRTVGLILLSNALVLLADCSSQVECSDPHVVIAKPLKVWLSVPQDLDDGELEAGDQQAASHWSYLDQTEWADEYPICTGKSLRQSPIDIVTSNLTLGAHMKIELIDYDQEVEFELKNTHHSLSLTPIASLAKPTIRLNFAPTLADYELQEIHFHWGDGIKKGSEHKINGKRAAAEMHMVHYKRGIDKAQIGSVENSVAVVGVFIESDNIEHNKLEPIVKKAEHVNGTDTEYKDSSPFNLINMLPENHHSFYTYNGSLTTPPCYEVVTWIVLSEPVYMSQEKVSGAKIEKFFFSLKLSNSKLERTYTNPNTHTQNNPSPAYCSSLNCRIWKKSSANERAQEKRLRATIAMSSHCSTGQSTPPSMPRTPAPT